MESDDLLFMWILDIIIDSPDRMYDGLVYTIEITATMQANLSSFYSLHLRQAYLSNLL